MALAAAADGDVDSDPEATAGPSRVTSSQAVVSSVSRIRDLRLLTSQIIAKDQYIPRIRSGVAHSGKCSFVQRNRCFIYMCVCEHLISQHLVHRNLVLDLILSLFLF